jgi:hypothetical protein
MTVVSNQSNDAEQITRGQIGGIGVARVALVPYTPIVSYATGYVQAYSVAVGGDPYIDPTHVLVAGTVTPVAPGTPTQTVLWGELSVFFSDREWVRHESGDRSFPFDPGSVDRLRVTVAPDSNIYLVSPTWGNARGSYSVQEQNRVLFGFSNGITHARQALYTIGLAKVFIPNS